jgi:hypothetical protein
MFLAQFTPAGAHVWSGRYGGSGMDYPQAVAVDGSGNLVVAGYYHGTANFGGEALVSAGSSDVFVAKYSSAGAHLWSKRFGDNQSQWAYSVAVDGAGEVVVGGAFNGTMDFGGVSLVNSDGSDAFVVKLSAGGNHVWSRSSGTVSPMGDVVRGVAADRDGNVVITGTLVSASDFGGGPLLNAAGVGTYDIFVAKYSASGAHQWSRRYGGGGDDRGTAAVMDANGNSIIGGWFMESVDFGGGVHPSPGGMDSFVVKFGP